MCAIQVLEEQLSPNGDKIVTEFDCPIATITKQIFFVSSTYIMGPISVAHLCSETCTILQIPSSRVYEREEVTLCNSKHVVYKHDFDNKLYCINIFCIGNYFHTLR